jgi:hypothetical protein
MDVSAVVVRTMDSGSFSDGAAELVGDTVGNAVGFRDGDSED